MANWTFTNGLPGYDWQTILADLIANGVFDNQAAALTSVTLVSNTYRLVITSANDNIETTSDRTIVAGTGLSFEMFDGATSVFTLNTFGLDRTFTDVQAVLDGSGAIQDIFAVLAPESMTITGSGDPEALFGGSSADSISGNLGDDTIVGGAGIDTIDGGGGVDTLDYSQEAGTTGITVNLSNGTVVDTFGNTDAASNVEIVIGTSQADSFVASDTGNTLSGGDGSDTLTGGLGNDSLAGGEQDDWFFASGGDDTIDGGNGDGDVVFLSGATVIDLQAGTATYAGGTINLSGVEGVQGSAGDDVITLLDNGVGYGSGRGGADTITSGAAGNYVNGGSGNDQLNGSYVNYGDDGNDVSVSSHGVIVNVSGGSVTYDIGTGDQTVASGHAYDNWGTIDELNGVRDVSGSGFADVIVGGDEDNRFNGDGGNDTLIGGNGNNDLDGGAGDDNLVGGNGHDFFQGGDGSDYIDGGDNWDTVGYASETGTLGIIANLGEGTVRDTYGNIDYVNNVEAVLGSQNADVFNGGVWDDNFQGLAGNDTFNGGGGSGFDYVDYSNDGNFDGGSNSVFVNLSDDDLVVGLTTIAAGHARDGFLNDDTLIDINNIGGSQTNDVIVGNGHRNNFDGNDGQDSLVGYGGEDDLRGGGDNDTLDGGDDRDNLNGGDGNDSLIGGDGDDNLDGGRGDDTVVGGAGQDWISGSSGTDSIDAGADNDTLSFDGYNANPDDDNNEIDQHEQDGIIVELSDLGTGALGAGTLSGQYGEDSLGAALGVAGTFENLERIRGTRGADTFTATDASFVGTEDSDQTFGGRATRGITSIVLVGGDGADVFNVTQHAIIDYDEEKWTHVDFNGDNDHRWGDLDTEIGVAINASSIDQMGVSQKPGRGQGGTPINFNLLQNTAIDTYGNTDVITAGNAFRLTDANDVIFASDTGTWVDARQGDDTFVGGLGNDQFNGRDGDDSGAGGSGDDNLNGDDGNDTLLGGAGNDQLSGSQGDDSLDGGANDDNINGDDGNDTIIGGIGNDGMDGGQGSDSMDGGTGNDDLNGGDNNDTLFGGDGIDNLSGGQGEDSLDGGAGRDELRGEDGNDTAWGGLGSDRLEGQSGTDELHGDDAAHSTLDGSDEINGDDGNDTLYGGAGDDRLGGGNDNDVVFGDAGNDQVNGDDGNDTLIGGRGADRINGGWAGGSDVLSGDDALTAGTAGQLQDGVDASGGNDKLWGGDGNDTLYGGFGDDELEGQEGSDKLYGGAGNDRLQGGDDNSADQLFGGAGSDDLNGGQGADSLDGGAGNDHLYAGDGAFKDTLLGAAGNDHLDGGDGNDSMDGGADNDILNGGNGNDTLIGSLGADRYYGGNGNDTYDLGSIDPADLWEAFNEGTDTILTTKTRELNDVGSWHANDIENLTMSSGGTGDLTGNALKNVLDGSNATSANILKGLAGDDTYIVGAGDTVNETAAGSGGTDLVKAFVTFTLGTNVENLILMGNSVINGTGNSGSNSITGNSVANILNGGAGTDTLIGGDGNDTYTVDSLTDTITEAATANAGSADLVNFTGTAGQTLTLSINIEQLTLLGGATTNGTGNSGNNTITGNSVANILNGGAGTDTLIGGDGNDTYTVDSLTDTITEAATANAGSADLVNFTGTAGQTLTLSTNVEKLTLLGSAATNGTGNASGNTITGNTANNILSGADGNDTIGGGNGNDTIFGGAGNDSLTGGGNNDTFVFNTATSATTNVDTITDYNVAADTIQLENAIFTALGAATGTLTAAAFYSSAAGVAHDADDRIIYESDTGKLFYDSNGNAAGGAVQIAILTANPVLTNADFVII